MDVVHQGVGGVDEVAYPRVVSRRNHGRIAPVIGGPSPTTSTPSSMPLRPPGRSIARSGGYCRALSEPGMVTVRARVEPSYRPDMQAISSGALVRRSRQALGGSQWPALTGSDVPVTHFAKGDA